MDFLERISAVEWYRDHPPPEHDPFIVVEPEIEPYLRHSQTKPEPPSPAKAMTTSLL